MTTFSLFNGLVCAFYIFYEICLCNSIVNIPMYTWCIVDAYYMHLGLLFDALSSSMLLIVLSISFLVHLYSMGYMSEDPYITRFMSYLSLFTFFMLLLVTANNFIQMFIGWEGVGLCSYLLINFWFTRVLANKAALKAMIMNRIADVVFILAILIIIACFKTVDYIMIEQAIPLIIWYKMIFFGKCVAVVDLITLFLFVGAIGKSAQIILHTWLPDAMEGPTPVSALLHAATMVTAGVFLVIRCSFVFEYSKLHVLLLIFGGLTAIFAAVVAIFQYDVKKIIAYSTCSQLGYMFFTCGLSNYGLAFFHLFNHAFFKALLFLSAGALIHALYDEQDMRRMSNLKIILPFTYICLVIGSLSIMGFPFLTGFYSKDIILEFTYSRFIIESVFIYVLGLMAAIFTAVYSFRLIYFIFIGSNSLNTRYGIWKSTVDRECYRNNMFISMLILCILSIMVGYLFHDLMIGCGQSFWNGAIKVLPEHNSIMAPHFVNPLIKILPVILSLCGAFSAHLLYKYLYKYSYLYLVDIFGFFYHAGFFNCIYNYFFIWSYNWSYTLMQKYMDKGLFEYIGPFGIYKGFNILHYLIKELWIVNIRNVVFFMFVAICIFISFLSMWVNFFYILLIKQLGSALIICIKYQD